MSDLVQRLREWEPCRANGVCRVHDARSGCICAEAADRIEGLEAWIAEIRSILKNSRVVVLGGNSSETLKGISLSGQLSSKVFGEDNDR